jgi:hypothetical protein
VANLRELRYGEVRRTPKFSGSRPVASRNSLLRFLAPFVTTWGGDRGWSRSTRHDGGLIGDETPEIATANFAEFYFPRTSVNKGKKEGRVRLDWSDAAGSGLWLLED